MSGISRKFCLSETLTRIAAPTARQEKMFVQDETKKEITALLDKIRAGLDLTDDTAGTQIKNLLPQYNKDTDSSKSEQDYISNTLGVRFGSLPIDADRKQFAGQFGGGRLVFCKIYSYSHEQDPFPMTEVKSNWLSALKDHYEELFNIVEKNPAYSAAFPEIFKTLVTLRTKLKEQQELYPTIAKRGTLGVDAKMRVITTAVLFAAIPPAARIRLIKDFAKAYIHRAEEGSAGGTVDKASGRPLCIFLVPEDPFTHYWVKPKNVQLKTVLPKDEITGISLKPELSELVLNLPPEQFKKYVSLNEDGTPRSIALTPEEVGEGKRPIYQVSSPEYQATKSENKEALQLVKQLRLGDFTAQLINETVMAFSEQPTEKGERFHTKSPKAFQKIREIAAGAVKEEGEADPFTYDPKDSKNYHKILGLQSVIERMILSGTDEIRASYSELKVNVAKMVELRAEREKVRIELKDSEQKVELGVKLSAIGEALLEVSSKLLANLEPFLFDEEKNLPDLKKYNIAYSLARNFKSDIEKTLRDKYFKGRVPSSIVNDLVFKQGVVPTTERDEVNAYSANKEAVLQFQPEENPLCLPSMFPEDFQRQDFKDWPTPQSRLPGEFKNISWANNPPEKREADLTALGKKIEEMKALKQDYRNADSIYKELLKHLRMDRLKKYIRLTFAFGIESEAAESQESLKAAKSIPPLYHENGFPVNLRDLLGKEPKSRMEQAGAVQWNPISEGNNFGWGVELPSFIKELIKKAIEKTKPVKKESALSRKERIFAIARVIKATMENIDLENEVFFDTKGKQYPSESAFLESIDPTSAIDPKEEEKIINELIEIAKKELVPGIEGILGIIAVAEEFLKLPSAPVASAVAPTTPIPASTDLPAELPDLEDEPEPPVTPKKSPLPPKKIQFPQKEETPQLVAAELSKPSVKGFHK